MTMGMVYSMSFDGQSITAADGNVDLFELLCPSDAVFCLLHAELGQSSDAGDAEAELIRISILRIHTSFVSGSGGAAGVEEPFHVGYSTAGTVTERNNETVATGTADTMLSTCVNVQASPAWFYEPIPERRVWISPSDALVIRVMAAVADTLTISGSITWAEYGG